MFVDFGVDPRAIDTMSLAEIHSMCVALAERNGKVEPPPKAERDEEFRKFAEFVSGDSSVRI